MVDVEKIIEKIRVSNTLTEKQKSETIEAIKAIEAGAK